MANTVLWVRAGPHWWELHAVEKDRHRVRGPPPLAVCRMPYLTALHQWTTEGIPHARYPLPARLSLPSTTPAAILNEQGATLCEELGRPLLRKHPLGNVERIGVRLHSWSPSAMRRCSWRASSSAAAAV